MSSIALIQCGDYVENQRRILPLALGLREQGWCPVVLTYRDKGAHLRRHGIEVRQLARAKAASVWAKRGVSAALQRRPKEIPPAYADEALRMEFARRPKISLAERTRLRLELHRRAAEVREVLDELSPEFVFIWNGNTGLVAHCLRAEVADRGIAASYLERGYWPRSVFVDPQGTGGDSAFATRAIESRVGLELPTFDTTPTTTKPERFLFVPLQVQTDTNLLLHSPYLASMRGLVELVLSAAQATDYHIVVRPHPEEVDTHLNLPEGTAQLAYRTDGTVEEWCHQAEAVITINSTVGLTAALMGKPVFHLGTALFSNKGIATSVDPDGLHEALAKGPFVAPDPAAVARFYADLAQTTARTRDSLPPHIPKPTVAAETPPARTHFQSLWERTHQWASHQCQDGFQVVSELRDSDRIPLTYRKKRERTREQDVRPAVKMLLSPKHDHGTHGPKIAVCPQSRSPQTRDAMLVVDQTMEPHIEWLEASHARRTPVVPRPRPKLGPRVAAILDEFSWENFSHDIDLFPLSPVRWRQEIERIRPDILLVESAWAGNQGRWSRMFVDPKPHHRRNVQALIAHCRRRSIPTVFWNKEDPPNYDAFINSAKLFDFIFTTDANCIERYAKDAPGIPCQPIPFAAQPAVQNPIDRHLFQPLADACFAGAWYPKYPERQKDARMLLDAARRYQLDIYDRYLNHPAHERFLFPDEYQPYIRGSLAFDEMLEKYRQYSFFLNVNTVKDSPTMFSRRVFELLACGTSVVTTPSLGISEMLGHAAFTCSTSEEAAAAMGANPSEHSMRVVRGMRTIFGQHTYRHRLTTILNSVGISPRNLTPTLSVVTTVADREDVKVLCQNLNRQTVKPHDVVCFGPPALRSFVAEAVDLPLHYEPPGREAWHLTASRVSEADAFAYFDVGDYYGAHYLEDATHALDYSGAEAVGKGRHFAYDGRDIRISSTRAEHCFAEALPSTLVVRRDVTPVNVYVGGRNGYIRGFHAKPKTEDFSLYFRCATGKQTAVCDY